MKPALIILVMLGFVLGCSGIKQAHRATEQGIKGTVYMLEGDFMPRIGDKPPGTKKPVQREILIYKPIVQAFLNGQDGPLYHDLPGEPVAVVMSNEHGQFTVLLPPATYSIFTREPQTGETEELFANFIDRQGIINPVQVSKGSFTEIEIKINHKAVF